MPTVSLQGEHPSSAPRLRCFWEISAHQRAATNRPKVIDAFFRSIASFGRMLDLHARVINNGSSACVLRSSRPLAVLGWTLLAGVGLAVNALGTTVAASFGTVIFAFGAMSTISATEAFVHGRAFETAVTHVLTDVVRFEQGERGSGRALTIDVRDRALARGWTLGGTAGNVDLVRKFYEPLGFVAEETDELRFVAA